MCNSGARSDPGAMGAVWLTRNPRSLVVRRNGVPPGARCFLQGNGRRAAHDYLEGAAKETSPLIDARLFFGSREGSARTGVNVPTGPSFRCLFLRYRAHAAIRNPAASTTDKNALLPECVFVLGFVNQQLRRCVSEYESRIQIERIIGIRIATRTIVVGAATIESRISGVLDG